MDQDLLPPADDWRGERGIVYRKETSQIALNDSQYLSHSLGGDDIDCAYVECMVSVYADPFSAEYIIEAYLLGKPAQNRQRSEVLMHGIVREVILEPLPHRIKQEQENFWSALGMSNEWEVEMTEVCTLENAKRSAMPIAIATYSYLGSNANDGIVKSSSITHPRGIRTQTALAFMENQFNENGLAAYGFV